jgi:hypothetical protein
MNDEAIKLNQSSGKSVVANMLAGGLCAVLCVMTFQKTAAAQASTTQAPPTQGSAVVVELFTSEGCSSCPPADQLLAKLEAEQPFRNVEIIALEQHVDYWNSGGWFDPFSSSTATLRQYAYASALSNGNAYTPQMVVDGQNEFIGSRAGQVRSTIEQAGTRKKTEVTLSTTESARGEKFHVSVGAIANLSSGDTPEIWMVITETGLHSNVRGGENSGEDLHHAAVVRKMWKIGTAKDLGATSFSADVGVKIDRDWKRENTRVVAFVQEKKSKKILGAGSYRLQPQS